MRMLAILAVGAVVTLSAIGQNAPPTPADDAAVRDVVRRYVDAREKRDPALLAALFTADADQITTFGEWRKGPRQSPRSGTWRQPVREVSALAREPENLTYAPTS